MNSQDISIKDETNDYFATVDINGFLSTKARIWDGSNFVTVTGNKLDVNASMTWANTNKVIVWDGTNNIAIDSSGRLTVIQPTASLLNATIGNGAGASAVNIQDGGNSITVDGTFWPATQPVSGTVSATQGTSPWVTSNNNAGGVSAVNIQDGGNSITIDGSISNTAFGVNNGAGASAVNIQDGGNSITIDGSISNTAFGVNNAAGASAVNIQDGGNSITVDGTVAFSNTTIAVTQATASNLNATVFGNKTPSDAYANPTNAQDSTSLSMGFNGTTWDRIRSEGDASDAVATRALGNLSTEAYNMVFNGTTWDRMRGTSGALNVNITGTTGSGQQNIWQQKTFQDKTAFITTTNLTSVSGTAEVGFMQLVNPNASGKTVRIKKIACYTETTGSTVSFVWFRMYRDPTITNNGSAQTINKIYKGQATATVCSAYKGPTASANGTLLHAICTGTGAYGEEEDLGWILTANEILYLTCTPGNTGKNHAVTIFWEEE